MVYLRATPLRLAFRHQWRGKLGPRYLGPCQIKGQVGPVTYQLVFQKTLVRLHNVFHVSQLRKHIYNPKVGFQVEETDLKPNLMFEVQPV